MFVNAYIDGASENWLGGNPEHSSVGILFDCSSCEFRVSQKLTVLCKDNNQVEYAALLLALKYASQLGCTSIRIHSDCEPMVKRIRGEYRAPQEPPLHGIDRDKRIHREQFVKMHGAAMFLIDLFKRENQFTIMHIPREENETADMLASNAKHGRHSNLF